MIRPSAGLILFILGVVLIIGTAHFTLGLVLALSPIVATLIVAVAKPTK